MNERNCFAALLLAFACIFVSCARSAEAQPAPAPVDPRIARAETAAAILAPGPREAFLTAFRAAPDRFFALAAEAEADSDANGGYLALVDKKHDLSESFAPADLVALDGTAISVAKPGMKLRQLAFNALARISAAASADGVRLVIGSAYRSYAYQKDLFARNVASYGEAETARFSARAGQSQHQLGTAVDFSPIEDTFAATAAGRWVSANAWRFGFSQSFPEGLEAVTGYMVESWHWRYIGTAGIALQREYFGDVQQFFLEFLTVWRAAQN